MCYVAGIDKGDGTGTNQRTFRSGSNKYPRGEVCEQRLQQETPIVFRPSSLPTILPPPMEASSSSSSSLIEIYARWDHANSTRLESPYTNSCPNFRGVTRPLHPWEYSAKLPLPAPSTDEHRQMFLDWIRFSYLSLSFSSALIAQPGGTFRSLYLPGNIFLRISSIEKRNRAKKDAMDCVKGRAGLTVRW